MPRPTFQLQLVKNIRLAQSTLGLTFRVEQPFTFEAGQFISLLFEHQGEHFKRSYSIASAPEQLQREQILDIAIGLVPGGRACERLAHAQPGECFEMSGPFGVLTLPRQPPQRLVLAGTGTGVAPYRAMLPRLQQLADQQLSIHILMGARTRADLFYQQDFQALTEHSNRVFFEACLSRETRLDNNASERAGYVQQRLSELNLNPEQDLIYLCGNPTMIDDTVKQLTEQGFGPRQIKREKYTFSR